MKAYNSLDLASVADELRADFLNPATHAHALACWAIQALRSGDPAEAFALADRRCRVLPRFEACDHLLRAETLWRLGDQEAAVVDLRRAIELDPSDPIVNRQAVAWLEGSEARRAARRLIAMPTVPIDTVVTAVSRILEGDEAIVASLTRRGNDLVGWVSWPAGEKLVCRIQGIQNTTVSINPDQSHPLASSQRYAAACLFETGSGATITATFDCPGQRYPREIIVCPACSPSPSALRKIRDDPSQQHDLTVIVPVYEDYDATVACLNSLALQDRSEIQWASIVVNDNTPNPRITADLERRARAGEIELIVHTCNTGFATAVNAAADRVSTGDLLLLNADTLLPPETIPRLMKAAAGRGVGTVTPLSNNGEASSFPMRNVVNDLPTVTELKIWDRAAAFAAVGDRTVDLPNGVGFCMLIRRECWDAVGGLSGSYGRGYYEDVDLCLRARECGFRNVCALDIVIGHAGSRSFGNDKRALVVRNLATLERRHPGYKAEYAAFLHADPLRNHYGRIERALSPMPHQVLLVGGSSNGSSAVATRAEILAIEQLHCLVATPEWMDGTFGIGLRSVDGRIPQSIRFGLAEDECAALIHYLDAAGIIRVEVVEPAYCPDDLLAVLERLGRPIDLHLSGPIAQASRNPAGWLSRLHESTSRVLCSDGMTFAAATLHLSAERLVAPARSPMVGWSVSERGRGPRVLAVLSPRPLADVSRLITALVRRTNTGLRFHVVGTMLDDLSVMAGGTVFVSGVVALSELPDILKRLKPDALLLPERNASFQWLETAQAATGHPSAYFDWSGGRYPVNANDLALDPGATDSEAADHILTWFAEIAARV